MASRKFIGNFVAIDAIHQDRVRKEQLAQKNWEKNHGYMIEEIKKVITYHLVHFLSQGLITPLVLTTNERISFPV